MNIKWILYKLIDMRLSTQLTRISFSRRTMRLKPFYEVPEKSNGADVNKALNAYYSGVLLGGWILRASICIIG